MTTKPKTPTIDALHTIAAHRPTAIAEHDAVCAWYDTRIAEQEESQRVALTRVGLELTRAQSSCDTWKQTCTSTLITLQEERVRADHLTAEVASLKHTLAAANVRTPPGYKGVTYDAATEAWRFGAYTYKSVHGVVCDHAQFTDADRDAILALKDAKPESVLVAVRACLDQTWRVAEHYGRTGGDSSGWAGLTTMTRKIIDLCQGRAV